MTSGSECEQWPAASGNDDDAIEASATPDVEEQGKISEDIAMQEDKSQDDVDRIWEEFISLEENNDDYSKAFDVVTSLKSRGMDAHTYIKDEFNLIRSATKFTRRDDYYEMSRKGRKTLLNKDQRAIVLEALSAWEEKMEHACFASVALMNSLSQTSSGDAGQRALQT